LIPPLTAAPWVNGRGAFLFLTQRKGRPLFRFLLFLCLFLTNKLILLPLELKRLLGLCAGAYGAHLTGYLPLQPLWVDRQWFALLFYLRAEGEATEILIQEIHYFAVLWLRAEYYAADRELHSLPALEYAHIKLTVMKQGEGK